MNNDKRAISRFIKNYLDSNLMSHQNKNMPSVQLRKQLSHINILFLFAGKSTTIKLRLCHSLVLHKVYSALMFVAAAACPERSEGSGNPIRLLVFTSSNLSS